MAASRAFSLSRRHGYAVAAAICGAATAIGFVLPGHREVLFICYLPATALAAAVGGSHAGLAVAAVGGLAIWLRLDPATNSDDALALVLYVNAAALVLFAVETLSRRIDQLAAERDRARLLFQEGQHRTANNMMFLASYLRRERQAIARDAALALAAVERVGERLDIFSQVHRQLSAQGEASPSLAVLLRRLCESLVQGAGAGHVDIAMEVEEIALGFEERMILSLLLAEIVVNALKHAFTDGRGGTLSVSLRSGDEGHVLEVADNGRGLAGSEGGMNHGQSAGHRILDMLAAQLGGQLTRAEAGGLRTRLVFPRRRGTADAAASVMMASIWTPPVA